MPDALKRLSGSALNILLNPEPCPARGHCRDQATAYEGSPLTGPIWNTWANSGESGHEIKKTWTSGTCRRTAIIKIQLNVVIKNPFAEKYGAGWALRSQFIVVPCTTADSGTSNVVLVPSIWYGPVAFTGYGLSLPVEYGTMNSPLMLSCR